MSEIFNINQPIVDTYSIDELVPPYAYTQQVGRFTLSGDNLPQYKKGDFVTITNGGRSIFGGLVSYSSLGYLELQSFIDLLFYYRQYQPETVK